jgi:O-antigen ligase
MRRNSASSRRSKTIIANLVATRRELIGTFCVRKIRTNGSTFQWSGKGVRVRKLVLVALVFYLGVLAIAQTVYGNAFMSMRWLALSTLLLTAGFYWYSARPLKHHGVGSSGTVVVVVYLGTTLLTVLAAENPLFSGLKWVSHAAMIIIFLVFFWQSLNLKQVDQILSVLKCVVAILILLSWLKPMRPIHSSGDIELVRGAFGSPNSMGQVAAVGCLLFIHSLMTGKIGWLRQAEIIMACVAAWLVWSSGARSAMVASITGLVLMSYLYPNKLRGKVLWITLLTAGLALAVPDMPKAVTRFVLRGNTGTTTFSEQIFTTRASVWAAAWEGFKKRPLLGWGFGADDGVSKQWEPRLTSIGLVYRDSINDTLITLESTGIVGLMAYILLIALAVKQIPTRQQRFLICKMHGPPFPQRRGDLSAYHVHAIAFIISTSLIVTVQFDNTALSAGNFVSVTLWLCVALAGAIKSKAVLYESAMARYQKLSKRVYTQPQQGVSITRRPWNRGIPA